MPLRRCTLIVAMALGVTTACSGGSTASPSTEPPSTEVAIEVGSPQPPLPTDLNAVPFGVGQVAALGNLQVTLTDVGDITGRELDLGIEVRNGSLEPMRLASQMFRLYTIDGSSTVAADTDAEPLGEIEIESGATWAGSISFGLPDGSTPAMLLVDGSSTDPRILPGAFVLGDFTATDGGS